MARLLRIVEFLSPNKMTKEIDTFWETFNMSRCKTAMLVISIIITLSFAATEIFGQSNNNLEIAFFVVIGYWTGRTTKAKEFLINQKND